MHVNKEHRADVPTKLPKIFYPATLNNYFNYALIKRNI